MTKPKLDEYFYIKLSSDTMSAVLYCTDLYESEPIKLTEQSIDEFLTQHKIVFGIKDQVVQSLVSGLTANQFPLTIAEGVPPEHGKDGYITYVANLSSEITHTEERNFREIMRIPTVKKGEKIASVT